MNATADVLVIFAHPDDAELGAAGTVAGFTREGKSVVYAACTSGEKGTDDRAVEPARLAEIREREQLAAGETLGVREVRFLRYPDQGLEDSLEFRKDIVRLLRSYRPKIVLTSDPSRPYCDHRDHRIVGRVTMDAVYPFARDHLAYPDLLEEGLAPHKVSEVWFWAAPRPDHCIDITETFDLKLAAVQCHRSQFEFLDDAALRAWLLSRAEEKACGEAFALGEAFHREIMRF